MTQNSKQSQNIKLAHVKLGECLQGLLTNTGQQRHSFLASFRPNFRLINSRASKESGHSGTLTGIDNIEPMVSIGIAITFGLLAFKSTLDKRCTWLLKYSIL